MKGSKKKGGEKKKETEFEKKKWKNYGFDEFRNYDHWGRKSFTLMSNDELLAQFKGIDELYAYEMKELFSEIKSRGLKVPLREAVKLLLSSSLYTADCIADFIKSTYNKKDFKELQQNDISSVLIRFSTLSSYYDNLKIFALTLCINALDASKPSISEKAKEALSKIISQVRLSSMDDREVKLLLIKIIPSLFGEDSKIFSELAKNNKEILLYGYIERKVELKGLEEILFPLIINELPNLKEELNSKDIGDKIRDLVKRACEYYGFKEPNL